MNGQKPNRQRDRTWRSASVEKVLTEAETQTLGEYIDKRKATVAEWVALRPILEICDRKMVYGGNGRQQKLWWRQTAAQKQLGVKLEDISAAERTRCWESSRHGKGGKSRR